MLHLGLAAFNLLSTQLGRLDSWLFKHSWFAIIIHFNWFHPWVLNLPAHPDLLGWASITACGMYEFPRKIGMEQTGHTLDIHGYALCSGYHKLKPGRSGRTTEFCACWGNQLFWVLTWLPNCIQLPFQSSCGTVGPTLRWQPHPWWVQRLESLLSLSSYIYKHVGAKAYVAEIPHPDNITFLSPQDERKHWLYAAIFDFRFQDLGF